MKKFSKLFLSCAAVAAVTAAVATSAMAADSLGAIERTSGVSADSLRCRKHMLMNQVKRLCLF
mgnify:CR=1 FL=1